MKCIKGIFYPPIDPDNYKRALEETEKIMAPHGTILRYKDKTLDTFKCSGENYAYEAESRLLEGVNGHTYRIDVQIVDRRERYYKSSLSHKLIQGRFKDYPHPATPEFEDPEAWGLIWDQRNHSNLTIPGIAPEGTPFAQVPESYMKYGTELTRCAQALFPSIQADWFFKGG